MKKALVTILGLAACALPAWADDEAITEEEETFIEVRDAGAINTAEAPDLDRPAHIVLWTDQNGTLNSTNAIATAADMAAIAARAELSAAQMEAADEGYEQATNLLQMVASSVGSSPIVFASVELTSFVSAVYFDPATSKIRVIDYQPTYETKDVGGTVFVKHVLDYGFTSDIAAVTPEVQYVYTLDNAPAVDDWDDYTQVEGPYYIENDPITIGAYTFTNFYRLYLWVPQDRASGFFRVSVAPTATDPTGNVLDVVGVKDGYTGTYTYGNNVLNIRGGYIMATGTGPVSE